jgi:hypothetical protein
MRQSFRARAHRTIRKQGICRTTSAPIRLPEHCTSQPQASDMAATRSARASTSLSQAACPTQSDESLQTAQCMPCHLLYISHTNLHRDGRDIDTAAPRAGGLCSRPSSHYNKRLGASRIGNGYIRNDDGYGFCRPDTVDISRSLCIRDISSDLL